MIPLIINKDEVEGSSGCLQYNIDVQAGRLMMKLERFGYEEGDVDPIVYRLTDLGEYIYLCCQQGGHEHYMGWLDRGKTIQQMNGLIELFESFGMNENADIIRDIVESKAHLHENIPRVDNCEPPWWYDKIEEFDNRFDKVYDGEAYYSGLDRLIRTYPNVEILPNAEYKARMAGLERR